MLKDRWFPDLLASSVVVFLLPDKPVWVLRILLSFRCKFEAQIFPTGFQCFQTTGLKCKSITSLWTNFEAKTEQKISYPANFGGLPRALGKLFWPGTNFMCSVITKLKFWIYLEPPRISTSGENCRYVVGGHICPPPCKIGWRPFFMKLLN